MAHEAEAVLEQLIALPATSRNEGERADWIEQYLRERGAEPLREGNNVWCIGREQAAGCPTLLLNAHIDTVKPAAGWQRDPFCPLWEGDRLYGLGSNDCGGGLCSLMQVFLALRTAPLPYRLVFLASAEEEVSGRTGWSVRCPCCRPSTSPSWESLRACAPPLPRRGSWCSTARPGARRATRRVDVFHSLPVVYSNI